MEYPYTICGEIKPFGKNEIVCDKFINHPGWHSGELNGTVYRWE